MNIKKNILYVCLMAATLGVTSCKEDDKTILQDPTTFVLNTPPYAANYLYDLEKSTGIELTCTQPNFGYTAMTTYQAQVSLSKTFTKDNFETLKTTFTNAKMNIDASEVAVAATNLALAAGSTEDQFPLVQPIYIRLVGSVANGMNPIASNAIELTKCRIHFALPPVLLPETMNMVGTAVGGEEWGSNAVEMVPIYGTPGAFWRMVYLEKGGTLTFNEVKETNGNEFSYTGTTFDGPLKDEVAITDADGKIKIGKGGWYLLVTRCAVEGRNILYTVEFHEPNVYLMGDAAGNFDPEEQDLFSVPADKDGDFVSPTTIAASGEGGLRICVKLPDNEWWHTEFIFFGGKIEYRGAGGDQERVAIEAGKKVSVNFTAGTGKILD